MSPFNLYELLDKAGIDYEIVEIFEGVRVLSIVVDEPTDEELDEQYTDNKQGELT
jgi:hypothetical protein